MPDTAPAPEVPVAQSRVLNPDPIDRRQVVPEAQGRAVYVVHPVTRRIHRHSPDEVALAELLNPLVTHPRYPIIQEDLDRIAQRYPDCGWDQVADRLRQHAELVTAALLDEDQTGTPAAGAENPARDIFDTPTSDTPTSEPENVTKDPQPC